MRLVSHLNPGDMAGAEEMKEKNYFPGRVVADKNCHLLIMAKDDLFTLLTFKDISDLIKTNPF